MSSLDPLAIITDLKARSIFNSRGEETIEVDLNLVGSTARVAAPAGKSKGKYEVQYYPPDGVKAAVKAVEQKLRPKLIGLDASDQKKIDSALRKIDSTPNFNTIGGNTTYAISLAAALATANIRKTSLFSYLAVEAERRLPFPVGNVLGGGKHAGKGAPDIQEFLSIPLGAESVYQALLANFKVHRTLGENLEKNVSSFTGGRGDEGAWAPHLSDSDALEAVAEACQEVSNVLGFEIRMGLDVAASSFWNEKTEKYVYASEGKTLDEGEQVDCVVSIAEQYKLAYIEDPVHEENFAGFAEITAKVNKCLVVGDDLFVTNQQRVVKGGQMKAANAIIIKPNQVGTLTDTLATLNAAKKFKMVPIASHRSGETSEPYLAHLAVAFNCPLIKTGVLGGERVVKLNELLRIAEGLGENAKMATLEKI